MKPKDLHFNAQSLQSSIKGTNLKVVFFTGTPSGAPAVQFSVCFQTTNLTRHSLIPQETPLSSFPSLFRFKYLFICLYRFPHLLTGECHRYYFFFRFLSSVFHEKNQLPCTFFSVPLISGRKKPRKYKKPGSVLLSHCCSSIIGAGELDFRVRDGNGYCLSAVATRHN